MVSCADDTEDMGDIDQGSIEVHTQDTKPEQAIQDNNVTQETTAPEQAIQNNNVTQETTPPEQAIQDNNVTQEATPPEQAIQNNNVTQETTATQQAIYDNNVTQETTATQQAIYDNNVDQVKNELRKREENKPSSHNIFIISELYLAVKNGNLEIVKLLLQKWQEANLFPEDLVRRIAFGGVYYGISEGSRGLEESPFFVAIQEGNLPIVEYLVEYFNAWIWRENAEGFNAIEYAEKMGQPEIKKYLEEEKYSISQIEQMFLHTSYFQDIQGKDAHYTPWFIRITAFMLSDEEEKELYQYAREFYHNPSESSLLHTFNQMYGKSGQDL